MNRPAAVSLVALAVLLAWGLMWAGWKRRQARQSDVPALPAAPAGLVDRAAAEGIEGTYVSTTLADQPLERVTAHGLGATGVAHLMVADDASGLVIARGGAADIFVPTPALVDVRIESMRAGKATPHGLVVVEWRLGERSVATAFRPRDRHDREALLRSVRGLISQQDAA